MAFNLEINVTDNNTATWQVCLDNENNPVGDWDGGPTNFSKHFPGFENGKNGVDLFIDCTGFGGSVDVEVVINGESKGSITVFFNDPKPTHKFFPA